MGFQFANNWPYLSSVFPTMIDHVDPVNQEYFEGLMSELGNIEYYLGLHPQGDYKDIAGRFDNIRNELGVNPEEGFDNVKDKLENHGHTGGVDGKVLTIPEPGVWEGADLVGTVERVTIEQDVHGGSYAGFAYYDLIYLGPCEVSSGPRMISSFDTTNDNHFWQPSTSPYPPRGAVFTGTYGIFSTGPDPGFIIRFNPETWEEIRTGTGANIRYPGKLVYVNGLVWGGSLNSPSVIFSYNPTTHAINEYAMDGGENEIQALCTDGTYLWACCNTDPVKLIKFKLSDQTHTTFVITGLKPDIVSMIYLDNMIYIYSDNVTVQWARFSPAINMWQRWEPDYPAPFKAGAVWGNLIVLTLAGATTQKIYMFSPSDFRWWLDDADYPTAGMNWITIANNHALWTGGGSGDGYSDWEGPLNTPPGA